jgi:methylamine dehydrogenase heavy chain
MMRHALLRFSRTLLPALALTCLAVPAIAQVENVRVPDRPANQHWVWVNDLQFGNYNKMVLYVAETGENLGAIETGWEGIKLEFPHNSDEIVSVGAYMARGFRGKRTDTVTKYDKHTFFPRLEVETPPRTVKGWPDPTLTALTDDDAFFLAQLMTPASSVGVTDLRNNKFAAEIETTGCAHVMPAGKRRFISLCGDGSILAVNLDDSGKEASRKRYTGFFDADHDPLHGSGTRVGDVWYFVSHYGEVHSVDVSGTEPKFLPVWKVAQKEGDKTWVPGAWMQSLAGNARLGRLYVPMQLSDLKPLLSGYDFHGKEGIEVWVFDLKTKQLQRRIKTKDPITHIAVSQDDKPMLYAGAMWALNVGIYDEASGKYLRELSIPGMPTVIQPAE